MFQNLASMIVTLADPACWLASPAMVACVIITLIGLPLLLVLAKAMPILDRPAAVVPVHACTRSHQKTRRGLASLYHDQRATATIEFTMVFPILLFLIMLLTQSTLLMGGRLVVNQAAFMAARSAVVVIPTNEITFSEPWNTVQATADSYKTRQIRQAAVMAVLPVAGRLESSAGDQVNPQPLVEGLSRYYQAYNRQPPLWIERHMPGRLRYANAHTDVKILRTYVQGDTLELQPIVGSYTYGPRDPITVQVIHRMNLAVPYVGLIFADGRHPASLGGSLYTNIVGQCTLTNEGIPNALPPTPELRRIP